MCNRCATDAKVQRHLAQLSSQDQRHGDVRWHCSRHSHQCKRQCVVLEILCRIPPCQETVIRILGSKSRDRPDFVASQAMLTVEQRHTALVHCFTTWANATAPFQTISKMSQHRSMDAKASKALCSCCPCETLDCGSCSSQNLLCLDRSHLSFSNLQIVSQNSQNSQNFETTKTPFYDNDRCWPLCGLRILDDAGENSGNLHSNLWAGDVN